MASNQSSKSSAIKKDVHTSIKGVSRTKLHGTNALVMRVDKAVVSWTILNIVDCWLETPLSSTEQCSGAELPASLQWFCLTHGPWALQSFIRCGWDQAEAFSDTEWAKIFISRGGHLRPEWWDRVKGSSCCYTRCDCNVTVRTRCLFSLACQLLAVQGRRKRPRWVTLWK